MKEIQLTQGFSTFVDDEDFDRLIRFKWRASKNGKNIYAERSCVINNKKIHIYMHREIMRAIEGIEIDHINGDGLKNIKINLRSCSHAQNLINSSKYKNSTSKYKGVYFDKKDKRWIARISINGKNKYLGCSKNEIEAAKMYNKKAKEIYGEFSRINIIT